MYYFTSDTIVLANKQIAKLDAKAGGLLCILHCLNENIEENISYIIDGKMLRNQLSLVFDKEPKDFFENVKPSYIIFAKDWATSFFERYIKKRADLLACAVFFLRRHGFEREFTEEEVIDTFIKCFNLQQYKDRWFFDGHEVTLAYNQGDVEDNQTEFYFKKNYTNDFKSILFSGVIQKSATDLKSAGQIQTLYSGSGVQSCFLLSDEPLDQYYIMRNSGRIVTKEATASVYKSPFARNRIIFGAPGTGKSFMINDDRKKLLGENNETDYERVTFHPDYSYANFVGTYKPVMVVNKKATSDPDTDFVISVLNDKKKTAQDKYDLLFERFKDEGLTKLPVLLGLYTDEAFKTRKQDGSDVVGDNSVERNHGKTIRKYVNLISDQETTSDIAYEYVPGPFMRVYVNALKSARTDNPKPHLLIIEEINRANVAAVFGDIFQLLDRGADNISEYPIQASEDIKKYLVKKLGGSLDDYSKIRIPDNMFIWATMNSADQGVFPMDTAFKRRWDFTYLGIDDNDEEIRGKYVVVGTKEQQRIEWNELRKAINEFLAGEKINEDKQLGPYFIARNIVVPADGGDEIDSKRFCDVFKHKVLMYLFDDAGKQKRGKLFEGSAKGQNRYSKLCEAFDEQGIGIFHGDIQARVKVQDLKTNGHELDENGMVKSEE